MCSVPGLPEVGSNITLHITRVNLNPHSVLVEFGGNLNHGPEAEEVYQQITEEIEVKSMRQDHFEGKPGDICFVYDDKTWHRARILSKYEHEYNVFLIDKGKLFWASRNILAKCPHKLLSLPPTVELCLLTNISPLIVESGWSQAASEFIRSLCGKKISACVQDVMMPYRILVLDVPSVSKQMHELGFAREISTEDLKGFVTSSLYSPDGNASIQTDFVMTSAQEHAGDPETLHQYFYPELLPGTIEIITVMHVVHPLKIFCKLHVFSQELKKLSDQLHKYYEDTLPSLMSQPLSDGSPCATKGSDGKWYRSVLQQNTVSDVVKVFHVDYGIGDFVKLCNIRPLSARFFQLPVVTYACSLHGIVDKSIGWRTDQIDFLKSVVLDRIFIGKFEQHSPGKGVYHVTLYGNDNVNVNNLFGLKENCLSVAERMCADNTLETLNKVTYRCMHDSLSVCTTLSGSCDSPKDITMASRTKAHLETTEHMQPLSDAVASSFIQKDAYNVSPPKIEVGAKKKVWITCVRSVNQFYGHFAQNTDKVKKMTRYIQQLCRKRTQVKFSVSPKMMCFARYTDGQWHRGQIESTHPKILVHFVDYGNLLALDKSEILPLSSEAGAIASVPIQAVEFELFNVTSPESRELNEWFENCVTDCMFNVTVMKQDPLGKLSVEMYDEKTNLNFNLKETWNKTKRQKQGCHLNNGADKTHACKVFSEGMESRGPKEHFSTTTQVHEKICRKPVVQGALKQNLNFMPIKVNTAGHSRTGCNVLQYQMDNQQKVMFQYPKLTDLPSKALNEGSVSEVYLSHCNSPSSFFVHLTSEEDKIFSLLDELNCSNLSCAQVDLHALQPGDLVRAEYPADGAWYRAVVQNKEDGNVQVHFIDFGNEATLPPLKISQLGKQFLNTPRLSVHCSLENSTTGSWTKERVTAFKKAAGENGEKKICCKFISEGVSAWLVSLEHKGLVLEGPLFNVSHTCTDSQMLCTEDIQPLTFKELLLTEGQTVEAYATSICGPDYFWCQFNNSEELDKISLIAQETGNATCTKPIQLDQLTQGVPCLARFTDKLWYRAQVINKLANTLSVLFIDYGNESEIDINSVKSLSFELLERPPQAFLCQLGGFGSMCSTWSDAAAETFFELLVDEPLKVTIQNMVMASGVLKYPQYNVLVECKGLVVNDLMKDYWRDPKPQVCSQVSEGTTVNPGTSDSPLGPLCEKWDDLNALQIHSANQMLSQAEVSTPVKETSQLLFKKPDVSLGQTVEAFASCIVGPNYFWCQFANSKQLDQISLIAQEYGNSSKTKPIQIDHLGPGSPCLARFSDDLMWYRAQVIKKFNDKISVLFVDYGNESEVKESFVKALPCNLLESSPQAFLCLLEGFAPSEGSWTNTAADHFYDILVEKPLKVNVNCIENTVDSNSPPYYVKIETQQCLVNEFMKNFWSASVRQDQNSAEVFVSCENSVASTSGEQRVLEDNQTSVPHCAPLLGASEVKELVTDDDLHGVSDNKVDDHLDETDMIATITNSDAIANGLTLLENHKEIHESDDNTVPVVSVEQSLLHIEDSREDAEDAMSKKDLLETLSTSMTWAAGLEDQMLPKVCTEDLCDSIKCISK